MDAVIRQVDHVVIRWDRPEPVFELLRGALGLPVSWPIGGNDEFSSGGVYAGNCNLESAAFVEGSLAAHPKAAPPDVAAIAFEPVPLAEARAELDRRGLAHFDFDPAESGHEHAEFGWTNSALVDVSALPSPFFFLCEYHHDVAAWRSELRTGFDAVAGGPLGIDRLDEVVIGVPDLAVATETWQLLLDPHPPDGSGAWRPGGGVALRLGELALDPAAAFGLDLRFSQIPSSR